MDDSNNKKIIKINNNYKSIELEAALKRYHDGTYKIDKDYQREYVWNGINIKSSLIKNILMNWPIGLMTLWEWTTSTENDVIDGQQRIITIDNFKQNKFSLTANDYKEVIALREYDLNIATLKDVKTKQMLSTIQKDIKNNNLKPCKYKNLPSLLQKSFDSYTLNFNIISGLEKNNKFHQDLMQNYFASIQNQERLRAGEIIYSMPDNPIFNIFDNEIIQNIEINLNYNNIRNEIRKHIVMAFYVDNNKVRMGVPDRVILNKVSNLNSDPCKDQYIKSFKDKVSLIINENRNKLDSPMKGKKLSQLGFKLYLFTNMYITDSNYREASISNKIKFLNILTESIGYFNSYFTEKKNNIYKEIRNPMQNIWKLSKTTHSKDNIKHTLNEDFIKIYNFYQKYGKLVRINSDFIQNEFRI